MSIASHQPDFNQALRFITLLGDDLENWTFQTFDDNKDRRDSSLAQIFHAHHGHVAGKLADLNRRGAGIFAMINRGDGHGRKTENVTAVRAAFLDLDGTPLSVIMDAPLEPHLVVESSPVHYHVYWCIDGLSLDQFATVQTFMATRFKGDAAVKDLPRVMRLPGFFHHKGTPFQTQIIQENPYLPYSAARFLEAFGISPTNKKSTHPIPSKVGNRIRQGSRNATLASIAGTMQRRGMSLQSIEAALQVENKKRCDTPLDEEEVKSIAQSISRYAPTNKETESKSFSARRSVSVSASPVMVCVRDVKAEPIRWLWPGRIALGKVSLIAGDPGLGKSLITASLAAHVTKGNRWPVDKSPCPRGEVIMLSAEDEIADTIRPRLDAADADTSCVHVLTMVRQDELQTGEQSQRMFSLKQDLSLLDELLYHHQDCQLVIVDPITAYLDGTDSHKNADIRGLLAPLAELASKHKVAVVCVTHLNKGGHTNAMYRTTGSLAFIAAARSALMVSKDKDNPARRLVIPMKNNLGPDATGLAYTITQAENGAAVLAWEPDPVTISADDALSPTVVDEDRTLMEESAEWLRELLSIGPIDQSEIQLLAKQVGFNMRTVQRARGYIGAKSSRYGFGKGSKYVWQLPCVPQNSIHDSQPDMASMEPVAHMDISVPGVTSSDPTTPPSELTENEQEGGGRKTF